MDHLLGLPKELRVFYELMYVRLKAAGQWTFRMG
jgi:hypothetical protein